MSHRGKSTDRRLSDPTPLCPGTRSPVYHRARQPRGNAPGVSPPIKLHRRCRVRRQPVAATTDELLRSERLGRDRAPPESPSAPFDELRTPRGLLPGEAIRRAEPRPGLGRPRAAAANRSPTICGESDTTWSSGAGGFSSANAYCRSWSNAASRLARRPLGRPLKGGGAPAPLIRSPRTPCSASGPGRTQEQRSTGLRPQHRLSHHPATGGVQARP